MTEHVKHVMGPLAGNAVVCLTCSDKVPGFVIWDAAHQDLERALDELGKLDKYVDALETELGLRRVASKTACEYASGAHAAAVYLAEELTGRTVRLCGACLQQERRANTLRRWESLAHPSHIAEEVRA